MSRFRALRDVALMLDLERESREQSPSAAVVDSHSIKAQAVEKRGGQCRQEDRWP